VGTLWRFKGTVLRAFEGSISTREQAVTCELVELLRAHIEHVGRLRLACRILSRNSPHCVLWRVTMRSSIILGLLHGCRLLSDLRLSWRLLRNGSSVRVGMIGTLLLYRLEFGGGRDLECFELPEKLSDAGLLQMGHLPQCTLYGRVCGVCNHTGVTGEQMVRLNCQSEFARKPRRPAGRHGMGWDGMGWDGMGWDGMGWGGMGWDGMGWDGVGWDGMGWEEAEQKAQS
jgi:hypothetical protein